ncbi:MAG: tetratricopeptide repeat protein [Balneola sp.]
MNISKFIEELKRRNVFKVAVAYAIAGWLIIQIVTVIEAPLNIPDWFDTVVIVFVGIGFPLALIFAWAFELTPEGIKKSKEVEITESVTDRTGKKLNGVIISVLSIALFFVVVERIFFAKASILEDAELSTEIETASIAVLPFVNMSSDEENEYFSDGLSEELLNALAKVNEMKVAGRTSSFKFKGQNENLTEIGGELGVANILEGSVRKSGNRLRITAQLIRVSDGFHMWSETYDREFTVDNIFDIQEEISLHVMEELKVRLLPEDEAQLAARPTMDIEAYNAFLEATQREITYQPEDLEFAIQKYKEAIRIDPTFAEAYARLAIAYNNLHSNGNISAEEVKILVRENAEMAISLDKDLGKAHQALSVYYGFEQNFEKREDILKTAVELAPNDASIRMAYGGALGRNNKVEEAQEQLFQAYELDPLSADISNSYARYLVNTENRYDEAMVIIDRNIKRTPDYNGSYYSKAWLLRDVPYGELDNAFTFAYEAYQNNPEDMDFMWMVSDIARDLNMLNLAEYFGEKISEKYPDNHAGRRNLLKTSQVRGDFERTKEIVDELVEIYGERTIEFFVVELTAYYYSIKDYEKAAELWTNLHPEFFSNPESKIKNIDQQTAAIFVNVLLEQQGKNAEAELLANKICTYKDQRLEEMLESGRTEIYNELDVKLFCQIASEQYDEAVAAMEKFYFELNSKANFPLIITSEIPYYRLKESPSYQQFEEKLYADLGLMRENVIQFLKAEGEWKEEWETKN